MLWSRSEMISPNAQMQVDDEMTHTGWLGRPLMEESEVWSAAAWARYWTVYDRCVRVLAKRSMNSTSVVGMDEMWEWATE